MTKFKKIIASIVVFCLVIGTITATAAPKAVTYDSETTNYTATKISHPGVGLGQTDGIIDYNSGDADRGQSYSWSSVGYGDSIYVGTCYAAIWQTIQMLAQQNDLPKEVVRNAMNVAFNGNLYTGDEKNNPATDATKSDPRRSVIVKINTQTYETKVIVGPENQGGFRAAIGFKDKIYFCNTKQSAKESPQIIQIDPNNNDKAEVVYECGTVDKGISSGIRGITVCHDELVVSMIGNDGAYIVSSPDPDPVLKNDSFRVIATQEDLLDYPAYHYVDAIFGGAIFDLASFNDKLYITVVSGNFDGKSVPKHGFSLFEGSEDANGEWTYKLLVGDKKDGAQYPYGFGDDRSSAANMVVYDDHLYIGGYNDPMIAIPQAFLGGNFEPLYKDLSDPVPLWRMDKEGNWELVVGEPNEIFPEVVGNMTEGFNNRMCQYVWRMQTFNDKLYIGTFDITGLLTPIAQLCNGDILKFTKEDWKSEMGYVSDLVKELGNLIKGSATTYGLDVNEQEFYSMTNDLLDTLKEIGKLIDKGGLKDIKASKLCKDLLSKAVKQYEKVRNFLREYIDAYNLKNDALFNNQAARVVDQFIRELDGIINQHTVDSIFYFIGTCEYLSKSEEGFDLLVTEDGVNFDAITRDGFGDKYNHGIRTFCVNDDGLFLGTANPFYGTQVWHVVGCEELEEAKAPEMSELEPGLVDYTGHHSMGVLQPAEEEKTPVEPTEKEDTDNYIDDEEEKAEITAFDIPDTGASKSAALAALGAATVAGLGIAFVVKKRKLF